jgi:translation initiation factor IF-3
VAASRQRRENVRLTLAKRFGIPILCNVSGPPGRLWRICPCAHKTNTFGEAGKPLQAESAFGRNHGEKVIAPPRRFSSQAPAPAKDGPRVNEEIYARTILLIGDDGHKYGEIGTDEGRAIAEEKGLDLVEVSPEAKPPVVKLMDYGKFKYEQQKKAAEARKKQKVIEIKEIKMRPTIDDHDYEVKMKAMRRFFDDGDKVKITLRFRGREMAHQHIGMELLNRIQKDTETIAKMEQWPKLEGRQMMMVLAPR